MAILSVVAIAAIALQTNAIGFRVVLAVAVAWVLFSSVAWLAGVWSAWSVLGRLVILGLLVWGRGPFLPPRAARPLPLVSTS
jgi:O-antigen ligase